MPQVTLKGVQLQTCHSVEGSVDITHIICCMVFPDFGQLFCTGNNIGGSNRVVFVGLL